MVSPRRHGCALDLSFASPLLFNIVDEWKISSTIIEKAADSPIPMIRLPTYPKKHFTPKSWWTPTYSEAVARKGLVLKIYKIDMSQSIL